MAIDQYGQIIRRTPRPIPIQTNPNVNSGFRPSSTYTSSVTYRNPNLWERFDNFIGSIGNWIADKADNIISVLAIILFIGGAIPFVIWLFSLGWFWGIVAGVCLGGIVYYILMAVVGVFIWISNLLLGIVRHIFYSGKSFLITLAILGALCGFAIIADNGSGKSADKTEYAAVAATTYRCVARSVLNVRSAPNTKAKVIGTLKRNQKVEVYETVDGFARIKYNGIDGYASMKYLKKQTTD